MTNRIFTTLIILLFSISTACNKNKKNDFIYIDKNNLLHIKLECSHVKGQLQYIALSELIKDKDDLNYCPYCIEINEMDDINSKIENLEKAIEQQKQEIVNLIKTKDLRKLYNIALEHMDTTESVDTCLIEIPKNFQEFANQINNPKKRILSYYKIIESNNINMSYQEYCSLLGFNLKAEHATSILYRMLVDCKYYNKDYSSFLSDIRNKDSRHQIYQIVISKNWLSITEEKFDSAFDIGYCEFKP